MDSLLLSLTAQLTHFGLNPSDWQIEAKCVSGSQFHLNIVNCQDRLAYFEGRAEGKTLVALKISEF